MALASWLSFNHLPITAGSFCVTGKNQNEFSFWASLMYATQDFIYLDIDFDPVSCTSGQGAPGEFFVFYKKYPEPPALPGVGKKFNLSDEGDAYRVELNTDNLLHQYQAQPNKKKIFTSFTFSGPLRAVLYVKKAGGSFYNRVEIKYGVLRVSGPFFVNNEVRDNRAALVLYPAPYTDQLKKQIDCLDRVQGRIQKAVFCPIL
jgi:hypothetical protein